jgi:hypothetical protein
MEPLNPQKLMPEPHGVVWDGAPPYAPPFNPALLFTSEPSAVTDVLWVAYHRVNKASHQAAMVQFRAT